MAIHLYKHDKYIDYLVGIARVLCYVLVKYQKISIGAFSQKYNTDSNYELACKILSDLL